MAGLLDGENFFRSAAALTRRVLARHAVFYVDNTLSQPTSLLAESRNQSEVILLWADNSDSETGFEIDRALGDGSFSLITTTAANITTFTDTGRATGTRYRYRIRATDGSATSDYTDIATVVTHSCSIDENFHREMVLPRFDSEGDEPPDLTEWEKLLNEMVQKIETKFNKQVVASAPCDLCVVNGAITIDCARCDNFEVAVDADINSISMVHCDEPGTKIDIVFKTDAERCITGWPDDAICEDCGSITNRECTDGGAITTRRFSVGSSGKPVSSSPGSSPTGATSGGGGAGEVSGLSIQCEQIVGAGDFTSTEADCAEMDCQGSGPESNYRARGGVPPYSWSVTTPSATGVSPVVTVNITAGTVRITPGGTATDDGNVAYGRGIVVWTNPSTCSICGNRRDRQYRCDGSTHNSCSAGSGCSGTCDTSGPSGANPTALIAYPPICGLAGTCSSGQPRCDEPGTCTDVANALKFNCDLRTQAQKDSGTCEPCSLNMSGVVLTLTDSIGDSVSVAVLVSQ